MCDRIESVKFQKPRPRAQYDRVVVTCPHGSQRLYCRQRRSGRWWVWSALFLPGRKWSNRSRRYVAKQIVRWRQGKAVAERDVPEEVLDAAYVGSIAARGG